jgi:hypothetical protein
MFAKVSYFRQDFSQKRKLNFAKTFAKKTKLKTFVSTLMKFVAKPHHLHAAPTPS